MPFALALRSLLRHRLRTLLAVAGVSVSAAMLLAMVMLATGMRESFRALLLEQGFQIRLAPRGTLPFDTDATLAGTGALVARLASHPQVERVSPVLGGQVHVIREDGAVTALALGVRPEAQGDYVLLEGQDAGSGESGEPVRIVLSDGMLAAIGASLGDTLRIAAGFDPQLRTFSSTRVAVVAGRARFRYLAAGQRAAALPLTELQMLRGRDGHDRSSLILVRLREGTDDAAVRHWIERIAPRVTAISTDDALAQVDQRTSYFRQMAFILGSVSLVVGFLLVTTLVTVSVNERLGEIAILRALGVSRGGVVLQILAEGLWIMLAGTALGLTLGLVTARHLNGILADFPGLPVGIDFFLFQPRAAWSALGMLFGAGLLAGVFPAWRGASLPIAATLRQETVG